YLEPEWEMREFQKDSRGLLRQVPVEQTPDLVFNDGRRAELEAWLKVNAENVLKGSFVVPRRFLGAVAPTAEERFQWLGKSALGEGLGRGFSMATCNGCHAADTNTRFNHIFPRRRYGESELSPFLESELKARARDMESLCYRHCEEAAPQP